MGEEPARRFLHITLSLLFLNRILVDSTGLSAWGQLFAMSTLSLVPVFLFFLFFQRLIIRGVATSAMKR